MEGLGSLPTTFTLAEARQAGIHPRDVYRWRDTGQVLELSRGVFRHADAPVPSYPDFLAVARRAPGATICLISAASVWDLTDELPAVVSIAVPRGTRPPQIAFPPVEVSRFEPGTFDLGLTHLEAAPGEPVRMYSATRTVVDLMRLRHRIGEPLAFGALRRYLARRDADRSELIELARSLNVLGPLRNALDVLEAS
ncbi:type IV toxin-antitoxin system AbiEi family antitoxin domain-containing protein [Kineosporia sp. J2-2]|uniref:Type IV toxin-antitoxin system AbiEi family antitoxin domain-containing protein n=1 Tax=Kineosporia corallincola TaxID=2835133 RepID=A0ABS5TS60_9ACTN|nr:type IV toxin-antitoxin system AbiEi family antitoxin domain-containing protein [Kineosporia corallincola]MBT0773644.1 type IV toxin-antitoxin system AbiEi family antitoxin domain-containing protein [Kineosporia corallincola]